MPRRSEIDLGRVDQQLKPAPRVAGNPAGWKNIMADTIYHVIHPNDDYNGLTSTQLKSLCSDTDSWANFLAVVLGHKRFARMRFYQRNKTDAIIMKVVPARPGSSPPAYASLV